MKGKMKVAGLVCALAMMGAMIGCTAQTAAQKAQGAIAVVLNIAKAEVNLVPPADQAAYTGWVDLGISLNGQLETCLSNVSGLMGKNAKFASCFGTFASGLLSPQELAALRVMNPATQQKVQLYVGGLIVAINVFEAAMGNTPLPTPVVGPAPTAAQIQALRDGVQAQVDFALPAYGR